jgi:RNA-directed DNA polymerase
MSDEKIRQQTLTKASTMTDEVIPRGNIEMADLFIAKHQSENPMFGSSTMEEIFDRSNLLNALKRVQQNKGAPGIDGMTVDELSVFLKTEWPSMKKNLFDGSYRPQPVKRVEIPKAGNKKETRNLGIPCVVDRFIQQAILQVLQEKWDKTFSENSFGFRPGRSAHQAILQAQSYLQEGYNFVVDIDLEKFFDKVCHDRLMSSLSKEIEDKRLLKLIRAYLNAGIMDNGTFQKSTVGAPQGGPLSPFLSNVVLDELDKELERRGHKFVRYADDQNIYMKSKRAAERVMESISEFVEKKLKLKVNSSKSAVGLPQKRKFLGFSFTGGINPKRRKVAPESIKKFKDKIRELTKRNWSMSMEARIQKLRPILIGWRNYFGLAEAQWIFKDLDCWIRSRLRCIQWKQWKVYKRRKKELVKRGISEDLAQTTAWSSKGPWTLCHTRGVRTALPNKYFDSIGLPRLYKGKH